MTGMNAEPTLEFAARAEWEAWLAQHHASAKGVWIRLSKKGVQPATLSRADVLEVALCWGWIDGQAKSLGETHWVQRFTPRRRQSRWSQINRAAAEQLIARGLMQPSGLAEVEAARADGRWDAAYASPANITVPDDLQRAFDAEPRAREQFDALDSRNRFAVLYRIEEAKRPQTRAARIEKFVAMLARGEKLHG